MNTTPLTQQVSKQIEGLIAAVDTYLGSIPTFTNVSLALRWQCRSWRAQAWRRRLVLLHLAPSGVRDVVWVVLLSFHLDALLFNPGFSRSQPFPNRGFPKLVLALDSAHRSPGGPGARPSPVPAAPRWLSPCHPVNTSALEGGG